MENTFVTFLGDQTSQEALPSLCKERISTQSNISRPNSNLAYNSVLSELTSKGRNPPLLLIKPTIPKRQNQQKAQPSETNGIIHGVNIGNFPESPNKLTDQNDKFKVNSMKCKKIFKQTITITDEDVKYENMKQRFPRIPDTTWPPVPPCKSQAVGKFPKEKNEGEVKRRFQPCSNKSSTGISSYPPWAKGNTPEAHNDLFVIPRIKPEIMRKPRNFQGEVAVLPPSSPQATIPESTSINKDTYETADLNMAKEREGNPLQHHGVNIKKKAVLPPSPPPVTIPESPSINEETYETADINMAKEWEQVLVRNNDTSSDRSSFIRGNSMSAQSKESGIADVRSIAKLDKLPERQDTTWPPVPPCTSQAAGKFPKEKNEGEVKRSFQPLSNISSTGISSCPHWAKGNAPGKQKDLFVIPRMKPEIMRKPWNFQGGVAVLPPSSPQATNPESTSINEDTYETVDLNMTKEREEIPLQHHGVNIIKKAVFPLSPPQATIPESTSISEETYETADLNMAKEWEQIPVRNNDTSSDKSSFFRGNSMSVQTNESITADVRSVAKLDELPERQAIKPGKRQKKINAPQIKSLPFINSLKPPKKPPRPPNVDLSRFLYCHGNNTIQITGSQEAEKADTVLSTETYEASISLSDLMAYDDTVKQESPGTRTCDYITSTDGSKCYQDIMPLSPYSDNVFEDNPVSPKADETVLFQKEGSGYDDVCGLSSSSIYESDPDSGFCSPDAVIKICQNHRDDRHQYRLDYADDVEYNNSTEASKKKPKPKDGKIDKQQFDFRKKYKISGLESALYCTTATEDYKGGKDMLSLKKGCIIEIIETKDCPEEKWLAKNQEGNYGFISVSSVTVNQEDLIFLSQPLNQDSQYDDVGRSRGTSLSASFTSDGYADMSVDTSDVISIKSTGSGGKRKAFAQFFKRDKEKPTEKTHRNSTGKSTSSATDSYEFPNDYDLYSTTITEDDEKGAKQEKKSKPSKQEREFRERFKYTKDIVVLNVAVVNELTPHSAKSKFDLSIKPGEKLDVIDTTDENMVICRNAAGKYGHVAVEHLDFISNVLS